MRRALVALVVAGISAGCGGEQDARLTVYAAASLREALPRMEADARYIFAGSSQLAAQLRDGARADVFVSASERLAEDLAARGITDEPVVVASNRLVVITPGAPARVRDLSDLAEPGVKLVLGSEGVPVGDYAREALPRAGLGRALANVVSLEDDVRGVVAKVALGEADAGVVYATDARVAGDRVRMIGLPDGAQPRVVYAAAVVEGSRRPEEAAAYLQRLLGVEGRTAFLDGGFLPPRP